MEIKTPTSVGAAVVTLVSVFIVGVVLSVAWSLGEKIWAFF